MEVEGRSYGWKRFKPTNSKSSKAGALLSLLKQGHSEIDLTKRCCSSFLKKRNPKYYLKYDLDFTHLISANWEERDKTVLLLPNYKRNQEPKRYRLIKKRSEEAELKETNLARLLSLIHSVGAEGKERNQRKFLEWVELARKWEIAKIFPYQFTHVQKLPPTQSLFPPWLSILASFFQREIRFSMISGSMYLYSESSESIII